MEKNYYDILEVNKNASPEIIEKAYKILAKKYHPDLQPDDSKKDAEDKMKELNEAYDTLSDPVKRETYNQKLERIEFEKEQKKQQEKQNSSNYEQRAQAQYNSETNNSINNINSIRDTAEIYKEVKEKFESAYEQKMTNAINKAYYDAYIQDLKNRGYHIIYKKTFKDYVRIFISILLTGFVLFLIYQIPPVKSYFLNFLKNNEVINYINKILFKK